MDMPLRPGCKARISPSARVRPAAFPEPVCPQVRRALREDRSGPDPPGTRVPALAAAAPADPADTARAASPAAQRTALPRGLRTVGSDMPGTAVRRVDREPDGGTSAETGPLPPVPAGRRNPDFSFTVSLRPPGWDSSRGGTGLPRHALRRPHDRSAGNVARHGTPSPRQGKKAARHGPGPVRRETTPRRPCRIPSERTDSANRSGRLCGRRPCRAQRGSGGTSAPPGRADKTGQPCGSGRGLPNVAATGNGTAGKAGPDPESLRRRDGRAGLTWDSAAE